MKARLKCSNCDAEMPEVNVTWSKKQTWFMIPIILISVLPILKMTFFKGSITKDLSISNVQTRVDGSSLEIIGLITNSSSREWSGITIEAEFFDDSGVFVDEKSEYLRSDIEGDTKEHFKIVVANPHSKALSGSIKPRLKFSGGHASLY